LLLTFIVAALYICISAVWRNCAWGTLNKRHSVAE
jgi:hypothetical protein